MASTTASKAPKKPKKRGPIPEPTFANLSATAVGRKSSGKKVFSSTDTPLLTQTKSIITSHPTLTQSELVDARQTLLTHTLNAARENFLLFAKLVYPDLRISAHHRLLARALEKLDRGEIRRLIFCLPPRSTKSLFASRLFPAWSLGRHFQNWQILAVAHKIELAEQWGGQVRDLMLSPTYRAIFPLAGLVSDRVAAGHFQTKDGSTYIAAGTTSRIAGKGANIAIIDDPLSEQDAYSKAERDRVIQWYPGGLRSRLQPAGRIALITTRWHDRDLAGYLLEESRHNPAADKWYVIKIPAILDESSASLLKLPTGTSYWPPANAADRELAIKEGIHTGWPLEELMATKENMPPYQWEALYMQRPVPEGGAIIKSDDWQEWQHPDPPYCAYKFISLDTAFSTKSTADFSAAITWGVFMDERDIPCLIMLGARKGRWEFSELTSRMHSLFERYKPDAFLIERKASGQSLIQELRRSGLPVIDYNPDRDKVARAHAVAPYFTGGRIYAPSHKKWAQDVIYECAAFPSGSNDDYVDCTTQAVLWVTSGNWLSHPERRRHETYDNDTIERPTKEDDY